MTSPGPAFQEFIGSCYDNFPAPMGISPYLRSTDGLTVLSRIEIVAILAHYQPSYNTSHTMKPSDPLLLANVTLRCRMCVCVCILLFPLVQMEEILNFQKPSEGLELVILLHTQY